ncbi:MAG: hypothetical protein KJ726_04340 [Verrucomicrobia bacterium]|nr:hypothetical protein [Verrucomicrobiota bacterium]
MRTMQQESIRSRPALVILLMGAGRMLTVVTGSFLLLFLVSSLFGGFKMQTPLGSLSCRHAGRLLLWTLAGALAWTGTAAGLRCFQSAPRPTGTMASKPLFSRAGAASLLLTTTLLLWARFLYRSYEPAFGGRPVPTVPFLSTHLLFLFSGLAALGAWQRLRRTEEESGAIFAALFIATSPLWFHVSMPVIAGYAALALGWWVAPFLLKIEPAVFRRRGLLFLSVILPALVVAWRSWGWAGKRLEEQFALRAAPGFTGWMILVGLVGWWATRRADRPWMRPALLLLSWGLVLGGARGEAGFLGALLMMSAFAGLMAAGIGWLLSATPLGRGTLGRNVIMVCLAAILLGLVRDGLDRGIRSPFAPPLTSLPAAESTTAPEEAPE